MVSNVSYFELIIVSMYAASEIFKTHSFANRFRFFYQHERVGVCVFYVCVLSTHPNCIPFTRTGALFFSNAYAVMYGSCVRILGKNQTISQFVFELVKLLHWCNVRASASLCVRKQRIEFVLVLNRFAFSKSIVKNGHKSNYTALLCAGNSNQMDCTTPNSIDVQYECNLIYGYVKWTVNAWNEMFCFWWRTFHQHHLLT